MVSHSSFEELIVPDQHAQHSSSDNGGVGAERSGPIPMMLGDKGKECAGINRHVVGDERALQERRSDSILTSSLAPVAARRQVKRRQRHRWAGRLSSEN